MKLLLKLLFFLLLFHASFSHAAITCTTTSIPGADEFKAISGNSNTNVIALGKNGDIYQYNGSSWTQMTSPTGKDLDDIHMLPDGTAYAVGKKNGGNGTVIYYNGSTWSDIGTAGIPNKDLKGVFAYSAFEAYAVGKKDTLVIWDGTTWTDVSNAAGVPNNYDLEKVWGDNTHVYVLGKDGALYIYDRDLRTWSSDAGCSGTGYDFKDLWMDAAGDIYLTAKNGDSYVYKYNGTSCSLQFTASEDLEGIHGSLVTGEIKAVGKTGTVVTFNGTTWSETTPVTEDLKDVWMSDTGNAYYSGKNGEVTTCEEDGPTVVSIDRADTDPTNASSVDWTVLFSQAVTGVDSSDFSLVQSGVSGASITSVSGSGATWTVTAGTGIGDGTLGLSLVDDDTIINGSSNPLGGTGTGNGNFTGQIYTIDKTQPAISSVTINCGITNQFEILFSEDVTTTSAENTANYSLDNGATITAALLAADNRTVTISTSILTSGTTYTVTVNNIKDTTVPPNTIAPNSQDTFTPAGTIANGIEGVYYNQNGTQGEYFTGTTTTQVDTTINNNWGAGSLPTGTADDVTVRWSGYVEAVYSEDYTFYTQSDDGVRLYVDGILVIDNWTNHASTEDTSAPITLVAGQRYDLVMEYYERGGNAVAELRWSSASTAKQIVPASQLFHCIPPDTTPPTIISTSGSCIANEVTVVFSEDIDQATAETDTNYTLDNGVTVSSASRTATDTVTLTTSALTDLTTYTVTINNVEDLAGNPIVANSTDLFTQNCSNLIAYYRFDEAGWDGTAGEVGDLSGNDLHGVSVGGLTTTSAAKVCNGAILDGVTLAYVEVADDPLLDIPAEMTVNLWLKTNVIPATGLKSILSKDQNYEFHINQYGEIYWWWNNSGGATRYITTTATVTPGTWHHIAIVYSRAAATQTIYIDGVDGGYNAARSTGNTYNETMFNDTDPLQIGGDQAFATREFDGVIDEVRIYERALSQAEIVADMNATHPCTVLTCGYRDNFSTASFSNNDGTLNFAADWMETGDDNDPATGDSYMDSGYLVMTNQGGGAAPVMTRELDMTGATAASLNIKFVTDTGVDAADAFDIRISGNGGSSWTTLETVTGLTGSNIISKNYPINSYISNNTQVRLQISGGYTGGAENISFYNVEILPTGICGGAALDHYKISHSGTGITCEAEPVTITGHDSTDTPPLEVTVGTIITVSTNSNKGDWIIASGGGSGTLNNGAADDGTATYTFPGGENNVVLDLAHPYTGTIDIDVSDNGGKSAPDDAGSEDPQLTFSDAGFRFYADGAFNAIGNQIGGKPSYTGAPADTLSQSLTIKAVQTSTDTGKCVARFQNQTMDIDLGYECMNPSTCSAGNLFRIQNGDQGGLTCSTGTAIAGNDSGASPLSYTAVSLDFNGNGIASFTMNPCDVGQFRLQAEKALTASGNDPAVTLTGASNNFIARPFALDIDFSNDRQNNGTSGPSYAADENGSIFSAAGRNFSTTVTAVLWQAGDDATVDGIVDSGANLTDNTAAANFGQESSPELVNITHTLNQPGGGTSGTLGNGTNIGSFISGAATVNLTWDEVGILDLGASLADTDYLGLGNITGSVLNVGRFTPDHFSVTGNAPILADGCVAGSFTYLDDSFGFDTAPTITITAQNAGNTTTTNYEGNFWKLGEPFTLNYSYSDNSGTGLTLTPSATSLSAAAGATTNCNGSLIVSPSTDTFTYSRPAATSPESPFTAAMDINITTAELTDTDTICYNTGSGCQTFSITNITGTVNGMRHGRLKVYNNYGPETENISASTFELQYYNGTSWVLNSDDSCTGSGALAFCADPATHAVNVDALANGSGTITVGKDASETAETVRVCPISPATLTSLGVCTVADTLCGDFTFGIFRGNDRIINWQEIIR